MFSFSRPWYTSAECRIKNFHFKVRPASREKGVSCVASGTWWCRIPFLGAVNINDQVCFLAHFVWTHYRSVFVVWRASWALTKNDVNGSGLRRDIFHTQLLVTRGFADSQASFTKGWARTLSGEQLKMHGNILIQTSQNRVWKSFHTKH